MTADFVWKQYREIAIPVLCIPWQAVTVVSGYTFSSARVVAATPRTTWEPLNETDRDAFKKARAKFIPPLHIPLSNCYSSRGIWAESNKAAYDFDCTGKCPHCGASVQDVVHTHEIF